MYRSEGAQEGTEAQDCEGSETEDQSVNQYSVLAFCFVLFFYKCVEKNIEMLKVSVL